MTASTFFWNLIARHYSRQPIADEEIYQKKLQITQSLLRSDMQVLEFGCGTGSTALFHAPLVREIHAVDSSKKMMAITEQKAKESGIGNVRFEQGAIEALKAEPESYDVVMAFSVLHLLEDREAVLSKVRELLKPGGVFVTSTACIADTMPFFGWIASIGYFFRLVPLIRVFGVAQLRQNFSDADLVIQQQWEPGRGKAVFFIVQKPQQAL